MTTIQFLELMIQHGEKTDGPNAPTVRRLKAELEAAKSQTSAKQLFLVGGRRHGGTPRKRAG